MAILLTIFTAVASIIAIALGALYLFFRRKYAYWSNKNVTHPTPTFPLGNLNFNKSLTEVFDDIYKHAPEKPFHGFWLLHRPCLMVNDIDLIKTILVQDFHVFPDHGVYVNEKEDPLANHLFAQNGQNWRNLRAKLSPTFTSGKMKGMFPIFQSVSQKLVEVCGKGDIVEMKDLFGRYNTDIIASCAYGIETSSLENPDSMFRQMGKRIFMPTWKNNLRQTLSFFIPDVARMFNTIQTDEQLSKFFLSVVHETVEYREKNNIHRNDVMQLLIQLKNKGIIDDIDNKESEGTPITMDLVAANAFVFFIGGFETASGVLQFACYHLAKDPEIQERLRRDIMQDLEKNGQMTYDSLFTIKYLGMVIDETLRKYPPAPILNREASRDYKIPNSDVTIEKGTQVYVCPIGIHHDERYYENPGKFDPERFSDEGKASRNHFTYLPFGEGPRFCIGQRFAQLQMRAALYTMLSHFKLELCEKTPDKIVMDPKTFVVTPKGGMHLRIRKL